MQAFLRLIPDCHKIICQFAKRLGDQLLPKGVDIDFQAQFFLKVQDKLDEIETLLNHISRLHLFDVISATVRLG